MIFLSFLINGVVRVLGLAVMVSQMRRQIRRVAAQESIKAIGIVGRRIGYRVHDFAAFDDGNRGFAVNHLCCGLAVATYSKHLIFLWFFVNGSKEPFGPGPYHAYQGPRVNPLGFRF